MSITVNSNDALVQNTDTANGLIMSKKSQSQQEIEGQMAMKLIQSADINSLPAPTTSSGNTVNIKV